jgi:hypothetical protein
LEKEVVKMEVKRLFDHDEGSEEVAGWALLIGVANELSIQLLVARQGDTAGLLVVILQK